MPLVPIYLERTHSAQKYLSVLADNQLNLFGEADAKNGNDGVPSNAKKRIADKRRLSSLAQSLLLFVFFFLFSLPSTPVERVTCARASTREARIIYTPPPFFASQDAFQDHHPLISLPLPPVNHTRRNREANSPESNVTMRFIRDNLRG